MSKAHFLIQPKCLELRYDLRHHKGNKWLLRKCSCISEHYTFFFFIVFFSRHDVKYLFGQHPVNVSHLSLLLKPRFFIGEMKQAQHQTQCASQKRQCRGAETISCLACSRPENFGLKKPTQFAFFFSIILGRSINPLCIHALLKYKWKTFYHIATYLYKLFVLRLRGVTLEVDEIWLELITKVGIWKVLSTF